MARRAIPKTWDKDDEKLMSFYGLDLHHPDQGKPTFGSTIRVKELADARRSTYQKALGESAAFALPGRETQECPTILNLANYFQYTSWGIDALRVLAREDQGTAIDFTQLVLQRSEDKFFKERVEPLRTYLLTINIYLYCIPATSYEVQPLTGQVIHPVGAPVLSILPAFARDLEQRGAEEAELRHVAGQMMWLLRSTLCSSQRKMDTDRRNHLLESIKQWSAYLPPLALLVELDHIDRNRPAFIPPEFRKELLPENILELTRAPQRQLPGSTA